MSLVANSASNRQSKIHFYDGTTLAWTLKNDFKANDTQTFSIRDDVAGSDRLIIDNSGNVGIGTTAPGGKLEVAGTSGDTTVRIAANTGGAGSVLVLDAVNNSNYPVVSFRAGGATYWEIGVDASNNQNLYFRDGVSRLVSIQRTTGNVGIGTTSPSEKLEVSGNIKASGTVSQGSSMEYKKNISYVSTKDAMNAFNKLNPVEFEYKTDNSGEKHLGFIAEDVPDLVAGHDRKHLNAMDITAVLTKVVQEQQRMIQEQKKQMQEQREIIQAHQRILSTILDKIGESGGKI